MPVYQVSYDLNRPGQNYAALEKALKATGNHAHILDSTWLIGTAESVSVFTARLRAAMDTNDRLFVSRVTSERDGWLGEPFWAWLRDQAA